jgi:hypothetical protein
LVDVLDLGEAVGNEGVPQMVFGHYRQLVTEGHATEWFGIVPPKDWKNITPMPAAKHDATEPANAPAALA